MTNQGDQQSQRASDTPAPHPPTDRPPATHGKHLTVDGIISTTWRTLRQNYRPVMGTAYTVSGIGLTYSLILLIVIEAVLLATGNSSFPQPGQVTPPAQTPAMLAANYAMQVVMLIGSAMLIYPLSAGAAVHIADLADGKQSEFSNIFIGFKQNYIKIVLAGFVAGIALFIMSLPIALLPIPFTMPTTTPGTPAPFPQFNTGATIARFGALLVINIVQTYFWLRLAPTIAILADNRANTLRGAAGMSWSATTRITLTLFLAYVTIAILSALSVFALCIGYFLIGIPMLTAFFGSTYALLRHHRLSDLPPDSSDQPEPSNLFPSHPIAERQ